MDRNRDLRKSATSTTNGLPRRRQTVTTVRDSPDEDREMELQETMRLRDRELLQKKDRDRDFPKRRRVDRSAVQQRIGGGCGGGGSYREIESTDSSDAEYFEEDEDSRIQRQTRTNQLSPSSSSLSNNHRGLRTFRSSPVLRAAVDELLGVPVPRRARSASAKRLHEYWNSGGSGLFGEDLSRRIIPPSPATVSLTGPGGAPPANPGASVKKKMKYAEPRTQLLGSASNSKPSSAIQDDIEIEVAEALFDLMKQSHSQSQSSEREEKVDRDSPSTAYADLMRFKAERGKDENDAIKAQNEESIKVNGETILADSMKGPNKGGRIEKEKFPDDPAQELVSGDGVVDKGKVGSLKESVSLSCVEVNACDIQDPTVTKADYAASVVEAKKKARIEIDLMALPSMPPSPERDASLDIDPKFTTQDLQKDVQKTSETAPKDDPLSDRIRIQEETGVISNNRLLNLNLEKHRPDISSVSSGTSQRQQGQKEHKNQSPTSLSFPLGMGSWPCVFPHPGYMPNQRALLPMDGSARSSMTMQPPQFNFSQPRPKRCATHQYLAHNIHHHLQLVKTSLSSGPTGATNLYGTKPLNFKSMLPTQRFISGNQLLGDFQAQNMATIPGGNRKDKSSDVAADFNATSAKSVLQQASNQAPSHSFLHNPGFTFPLGYRQTTMTAPANSTVTSSVTNASLPSNSTRKHSANSSSSPMSFNHPIFSSNEAAATYMAILQNSGCPIPIPTNIGLPSFKGGSPTLPFLSSSFYSPPVFNVAQNQHLLSQSSSQKGQQQINSKISDNKISTSVIPDLPQPEKPNNNNAQQAYSFGVGNNNKHSGSKNRPELVPQPFPLSFSSNASSTPVMNFSSMPRNVSAIFQSLPEISEGKSQTSGDQSLIFSSTLSTMAPPKFDNLAQTIGFLPSSLNSATIPNFYHHQHQMQLKDASQVRTDYSSFIPKWDNNLPKTTAPEGASQSHSLVQMPQLKSSQGHNPVVINSQPVPSLSSNSSISKNTSSNGIRVASTAGKETEGPDCRRNVPSILSTRASQLPEVLKY